MAADICSTCNHAEEAHAYDSHDVTADDFDEAGTARESCHHDGCSCEAFVPSE